MSQGSEQQRPFDDGCPHRRYAQLHSSGRSAHRIRTPDGLPAWLVTGYDEVEQLLADPRLARNITRAGTRAQVARSQAMPMPPQFTTRTVASLDGPEHARLRTFLNRTLAFKRVRALRPRLEQAAASVLEPLGASGAVDLMTALAVPYPMVVICDMLGIPQTDRARFQHWTNVIIDIDPSGSMPGGRRAAGQELLAYLGDLVARRRQDPQDDAISEWVHSRDDHGAHLDDHELVGLAFALLLGAYDTSIGMIGASLLELLRRPELFAALRTDPSLVPSAVEELLRSCGALHTARRFATEDMTVAGTPIARSDTVLLSIAAAGLDPARFPHPDELDFGRADQRHLAFGRGRHFCPGAELTRIELAVVIEQVTTRLPDLALAVPADEVTWRRSSYVVQLPNALPVTY
ncbi:cytochrome P450 [Micromonospora sp. CPCC 205539]|uniref:cytochrome P450 n=1 Tax=Micromonospora sp. CPCC 205539 TaxID=3122408 RepID=UPI002FF1129D